MAFAITNPVPFDVGESGLWGYILNTALDLIEGEQNTKTTNQSFADLELQRPLLVDYAEKISNPSSSSGTLTLDYAVSNHFYTTLTENVTTLTISNPPATGRLGIITLEITQDGTGSRTFAFPASFEWPGGSTPTISSGAGETDIIVARTRDGGTTWYAAINQNFG